MIMTNDDNIDDIEADTRPKLDIEEFSRTPNKRKRTDRQA